MGELLTTAQLARLLACRVRYIQDRCHARDWPHTVIGRQYRFSAEHAAWIIAQREHWPTEKKPEPAGPAAAASVPRPRTRRRAADRVTAVPASVIPLQARPLQARPKKKTA